MITHPNQINLSFFYLSIQHFNNFVPTACCFFFISERFPDTKRHIRRWWLGWHFNWLYWWKRNIINQLMLCMPIGTPSLVYWCIYCGASGVHLAFERVIYFFNFLLYGNLKILVEQAGFDVVGVIIVKRTKEKAMLIRYYMIIISKKLFQVLATRLPQF